MGGEQDMRKMGALRHKMPVTFWTFLAATLAICGVPPFAGFMSKDEIIWQTYAHGHVALWALLWLGAGMTAFYMFRQVYMTFFGEFRGTHEQEHHLHESPPSMAWVITILGILSIIGGFVMLPGFIAHFAGIAPFEPFKEFLDPVFNSPQTQQVAAAVLQNDQTELYFGGLSLLMVAIGWLLADLTYRREKLSAERMAAAFGGLLYRLSLNKYYVDEAYDALFVRPYIALTRATAWFDLHIIDGLVNLSATLTVFGSWLSGLFDNYIVDGLVNLTANATLTAGNRLRRLQTGSINGYLYGILAAVMLILLVRAILRA